MKDHYSIVRLNNSLIKCSSTFRRAYFLSAILVEDLHFQVLFCDVTEISVESREQVLPYVADI